VSSSPSSLLFLLFLRLKHQAQIAKKAMKETIEHATTYVKG